MNITIQPINKPELFFNEAWQKSRALSFYNKRLVLNKRLSSQSKKTLPLPNYESILQRVVEQTERYIQDHQLPLSQRLSRDINYWLDVLENELTQYPNHNSELHYEIMEHNRRIISELQGLRTIISYTGITNGIKHLIMLNEQYGPLFPIEIHSPSYADVNFR